MASTTLTLDGDGTTTGWTRFPASGTFASKVQSIAAQDDDTTYIASPDVATGTIFLTLTAVPADFDPDAITSITLNVRHRRLNTPAMAVDDGTCHAQILRVDEATAISTSPTPVNSPISGSYTTSAFTPTPTGSHSVADWNAAVLAITFTHSNNQTPDDVNQMRVTAAEAVIVYTPAAGVVPSVAIIGAQ
jgi:hypothetical protein